jgi:flagellar biosynthesis protein FlhG
MIGSISAQAHKLVNITKREKIVSHTKMVTITSGKGGVGKSTMSANIAYVMSRKGLKVCVVDADIGLANMQVLFDVKPSKTIFDYVDGMKNLNSIFTPTKYPNITLVAGKSGYQYSKHSTPFSFSRVIEDIIALDKFDVVIVDTGAGINDYVKGFLGISDNIVALTTTDPSALTDVYALIKMLSVDKERLMLCFNRTNSYQMGKKITLSLKELALKNSIKEDFLIKYIGNISESLSISTTNRLRKLFAKELESEVVTKELELISDLLYKNLRAS